MLHVAFVSLSSKDKRHQFENTLLALVREAGYASQNRLFCDHNRRVLPMSLSNLYALTPFAARVYANVTVVSTETEENARFMSIYNSLFSCARLISVTWQPYVSKLIGIGVANTPIDIFKYRMNLLDSCFRTHFANLTQLCKFPADLVESMILGSGEKRRVNDMNHSQRLAHDIIQILSKPNTHRMRELYIQLLIMWPHALWLGELSLEKVHQRIIRTLTHSNRHDEHILAMKNARFSDWQGRLHSCILYQDEEVFIDGLLAARLLGGPKVANRVHRSLPSSLSAKIHHLLSTKGPVAKELLLQAQFIFNIHSTNTCRRIVSKDRTATLPVCNNTFITKVEKLLAMCGVARSDLASILTSSLRIRCCCGLRNSKIRRGDILLISSGDEMCQSGQLCDKNEHPNCSSRFYTYRVELFLKDVPSCGKFSAIAQRFYCDVDSESGVGNARLSSIHLIPVLPTVTIWRTVHSCTNLCTYSSSSRTIEHEVDENGTTSFQLLQWSSGFPPRAG